MSRGRFDVQSFVALAMALLACGSEVEEPDGGGGAGASPDGGSDQGGAPDQGGGDAGGPSGTACQQYCEPVTGCEAPAPDCVAICEEGTSGRCEAEWDAYTVCIVDHFITESCSYDFNACEAVVVPLNTCLDTFVCLSQCEETVGACECSHDCVGPDRSWTCSGGDPWICDCFQDGEPIGSCESVIETCDALWQEMCCLTL